MDARHHLFELFDAHGDELFALAGILTGSAAAAEQAVADAFADVYDEMRRAAPIDPTPMADLARMRRAVCERCRPARRRAGPARSSPTAAPPEGPLGDAEALLAALRSLPADQRDAVALHCWLDLDDHDLAATLGAPAADMRALVQRGIAAVAARRAAPAPGGGR